MYLIYTTIIYNYDYYKDDYFNGLLLAHENV